MSLSTSPILAAAASNDLQGVRWLVERENVPVDQIGDWCVYEEKTRKKNMSPLFSISFFLSLSKKSQEISCRTCNAVQVFFHSHPPPHFLLPHSHTTPLPSPHHTTQIPSTTSTLHTRSSSHGTKKKPKIKKIKNSQPRKATATEKRAEAHAAVTATRAPTVST